MWEETAMKKKNIILIVGSNRAELELLSQQIIKEGCGTLVAAGLEELDSAIEKGGFTLALIDLTGFDRTIWQRCQALHKAKIPFIIISPQRSPLVQKESLKHGASGLLIKPLGIKELIEYMHTLLGE
jgi:DNA-binding response OmpR family regulator